MLWFLVHIAESAASLFPRSDATDATGRATRIEGVECHSPPIITGAK